MEMLEGNCSVNLARSLPMLIKICTMQFALTNLHAAISNEKLASLAACTGKAKWVQSLSDYIPPDYIPFRIISPLFGISVSSLAQWNASILIRFLPKMGYNRSN